MNGLGFHIGSFAHSLGRTASRCCKQNPHSCRFIRSNDTLRSCGLTCTRTTSQYHHFRASRLWDGSNLNLVIFYTRNLFNRFNISL